MSTITTASDTIRCRGLYSCAYVNYLSAQGAYIYCQGKLSCIGSTIYQYSTSDGVACQGAKL